ncbi:hypothetical protein GCM10007103_06010 [Salinimicrobium marinum]|uniref:PKD-like domain-containing protein n=1 Tax=Salinimicrobium marinum TaxID=680283 RepID=A0A918S6V1_9FLAO|nr:T9SS type A sorting domain-containing protein [Salinimicrobium marinum]GHA27426.1 hypothetical protein GCM10007103_06010 [Salinimicrobium marinum]
MPQQTFGQACPASVSIEALGGISICENETITLTAKPDGGNNLYYQWIVNGLARETGKKVSIPGLKNGDLVRVEVSSSNAPGCKKSSSDLKITVNPNISGLAKIQANNRNICPGETVNFSIATLTPQSSGTTFKWQLKRNGISSVISTSNNLSSDIFQDGDEVQLMVESRLPCVAQFSSNIIKITESNSPPAVPVAISGETLVCPGNKFSYSVHDVNGASEYIWLLPTGWTGSSKTNSIIVTPGTGNGNIRVKAKNGCGESEEQTLTVSSKDAIPEIPTEISGATEICPGVTATFSIPEVPWASEYLWKLPHGWTGSSITNSITVTTGPPGTGNIEVSAKNSCGTGTAAMLPVLVKSGPPAISKIISGPTEVCPGSTATYSIPEVQGAGEYIWELPSGWFGASNTNFITVTAPTSGNGEITVKVKNNCGTGPLRKMEVSVNSGTSGEITITGDTTVCPGKKMIFSTDSFYESYKWEIPSGWSFVKNEKHTIEVIAEASGESGTVRVTVETGCGTNLEGQRDIKILNGLSTIRSIAGPTEVCSTQTIVTYSIPAVEGASGYEWTVPLGWEILSGKETNTVEVKTASRSGTITVKVLNLCGDSRGTKLTVTATSAPPEKPEKIIHNLGPGLNICRTYGKATFSVPAVAGAVSYDWTLPAAWKISSGRGTRTITVEVPDIQNSSDINVVKVEAVNSCGRSLPQILEDVNCEDPSGKLEDRMFAVYISRSRQLIIHNPAFIEIEKVYINNLLGQELFIYDNIENQKQIKLSVTKFTPGVYLARIHSEKGILTKQIMLD